MDSKDDDDDHISLKRAWEKMKEEKQARYRQRTLDAKKDKS